MDLDETQRLVIHCIVEEQTLGGTSFFMHEKLTLRLVSPSSEPRKIKLTAVHSA